MKAPSKDPADYLQGQPGHPAPERSRRDAPVRWRLAAYIGVWALVAVSAGALGMPWSEAIFRTGFAAGLTAMSLLTLTWSHWSKGA